MPGWLFRTPRGAPAAPLESPPPEWLFAAAAEAAVASLRHVTPRSASRRKSLARRASEAQQQADGDAPCEPVALAFAAAEAEAKDYDDASLPMPCEPEASSDEEPAAPEPAAAEPAAEAAPVTLSSAEGSAAVGRRVEVYWPLDEAWYPGVVAAFTARGAKHKVSYDDGESESVSFDKWDVRYEGSAAQPAKRAAEDEAASPAPPRANKRAKAAAKPASAAKIAKPAARATRVRRA